ncbi:phage integrase SAM-like domain-containing protein [uncultured Bacteroides sp.]|uniref:tyrosine-type recombinase/integrase n=1 Tax=uncultured Bacteroides sp. TaxID=162156 RepID=UPI0026015C80|nr:phage integrase SAM-like domain-containing protein [uncultured Bacteroides sp.]
MATFSVVILPAKKMANNKHKIRIMVSHNSQTRYIVTDITLNSIDELKNGRVVKRDDKDILNLKIKKLFDMYFGRYMEIETADALTCTQLIKMISKPLLGEKHRKVEDVVDEYLSQIEKDDREKSHKLYKLAANKFLEFTGPSSLMEHITPIRINQYIIYLTKSKLSSTTINIYITLLKVIINYAIKMKYVNYEVDPFVTAKIPAAKKRETQITVDELKAIRDTDFSAYNLNVTRDIFMLTYYLPGMNLVDMLNYNFKNEQIEYVRKKTAHTKDGDSLICFNIPDEAKPLIKKYMNKNTGKIVFGNYKNYVSCYNLLARKMKELGRIVGIKHHFTLYSARKSFVQHGYDLGIPLSTLEYCIGQSMKEDRPIFNYVSIMKKHADKAIREILDNLK